MPPGHSRFSPWKSRHGRLTPDQLEFFVKSPLLLVKQGIPGMKRHGFGSIINIGGEVVELGNSRFANYISAKAARNWEAGPVG
jgi:NAD(P)-dependent dehydrogenase (short-subunit alcohol dehydrogenase family)